MHFLIAHKVRNEPAFDVAVQIECPVCDNGGCHCCEQAGFWWIIPTSGHRAYPYWCEELDVDNSTDIPPMPESLRDHYALTTASEPRKPLATKPAVPTLEDI